MDRKSLIAYSCGHLGVSIYSFVNFYLLKFYTDVVHLSPALVGYAFGIRFFADAITDPIVGYVSDHSRNRAGRRRPFLVTGSIASGLFLFLVFSPPAASATSATFVYLAATLSLLFVSAGIFQTPYEALAAELTYDYGERIRLSAYRKVFDSTGDILGVFVLAVLLAISQGEMPLFSLSLPAAYSLSAGAIGALVVVSGLVVYLGVRERDVSSHKCAYRFWQGMRNTWSNRPFRILLLSTVLGTLAIRIAGSQLLYILEHFFEKPEAAIPLLMLSFFAGTVFCIPVWLWLTRVIGKKRAMVASLIFAALSFALLPAYRWPDSLLYPIGFLIGAGIAGVQGIALALWPDVIEWDELQTGERREGSYAAMRTCSTKLSLGIGMVVVGQLLSSIGYRGDTAPSVETLLGLRVSFIALPVALLVASAIAMIPFPISRQSHEQALKQLGRSSAK